MSTMNARILVVEDNDALAENMAELFEEIGAHVTVCPSRKEALAVAELAGFDLAIVDIRLPGHDDGVDLVPDLRRHNSHGEVILVTGNATLDSAIAAVRHGAFAYILKPFDPDELLTIGQRAYGQVMLRRERRQLANELAASEALYRSVTENVEAAIVGIDEAGLIRFCNRFGLETGGYRADDVRGERFSEFCADSDARQGLSDLVERARSGDAVRDIEIAMRTSHGSSRVIRWTLTPLPQSASGLAVLAVGLDVTDRLSLERRTAESEAMAAMGRLTTGVAHEIRNPLNAAKLQLELLMRGAKKLEGAPESDRIAERAEIVRGELVRLSRMLEEFLDLARTRRVAVRDADLQAVLEEVARLEEPLAEARGISIRVAPASEAQVARMDRERIKQVLINLVGNAIEALETQGSGEVTLSVEPADEEGLLRVRVADTGPGLPSEVADQLFQPFVTTKSAGTGLGLSVVERLVELHGGTVQLQARRGGGTEASFTLPRARPEGSPLPGPEDGARGPRTASPRPSTVDAAADGGAITGRQSDRAARSEE